MENRCATYQDEHTSLMKIINYRLPHVFKKVGIGVALAIFIFLLLYKFYGANTLIIKDMLRTTMLLFLFLATMSKERFEDEFVAYIRAQSYILSFVCAIAYSIIIPLISFGLDILITNITGDGEVNFHATSAFGVMFMLTCFQLLFYTVLKKLERAQ